MSVWAPSELCGFDTSLGRVPLRGGRKRFPGSALGDTADFRLCPPFDSQGNPAPKQGCGLGALSGVSHSVTPGKASTEWAVRGHFEIVTVVTATGSLPSLRVGNAGPTQAVHMPLPLGGGGTVRRAWEPRGNRLGGGSVAVPGCCAGCRGLHGRGPARARAPRSLLGEVTRTAIVPEAFLPRLGRLGRGHSMHSMHRLPPPSPPSLNWWDRRFTCTEWVLWP